MIRFDGGEGMDGRTRRGREKEMRSRYFDPERRVPSLALSAPIYLTEMLATVQHDLQSIEIMVSFNCSGSPEV